MPFPVLTVLAILLAFVLALSTGSVDSQALVQRSLPNNPRHPFAHELPEIHESPPDINNDHELLDIVLVASIDGKFHAFNRTSGRILWSMSSLPSTPTMSNVSTPTSLAPLVRTVHPIHDVDLDLDPVDYDYDSEDDRGLETYIIEPQSGDIYVLHSPSSPLQRFPFSMPELVDISPFTSVNKDNTRVFVGKKETTLLLIELETGRIKATLNSECPFIPDEFEEKLLDLDELDDSKPPIAASTEVYIGRTDYHISIHKKPRPGQAPLPVQELSFSTYGPNNKDNHLQAAYLRNNDNMYIQSLTDGKIIAFRAKDNSKHDRKASGKRKANNEQEVGAFWGHHFSAPVVAIFDVLQALPPHTSSSSSHLTHVAHPFVLLQPRPRLDDLFPDSSASRFATYPHFGSAYVGLVEETGSLFVMSPERYPLVIFGGSGSGKEMLELDPSPHAAKNRRPSNPERSKSQEHDGEDESYSGEPDRRYKIPSSNDESDLDTCPLNPYLPSCLVGVRPLEHGDGLELGSQAQGQQHVDYPSPSTWKDPEIENASRNPSSIEIQARSSPTSSTHAQRRVMIPQSVFAKLLLKTRIFESGTLPDGEGPMVVTAWDAILVTFVFGLLTCWIVWVNIKARFGVGTDNIMVITGGKKTENDLQKGLISRGEAKIGKDGQTDSVNILAENIEEEGPVAESDQSLELSSSSNVSYVKKDIPTFQLFTTPLTPAAASFEPSTPQTSNIPLSDTRMPNSLSRAGEEGDDSDGEGDSSAVNAPEKRKSRRGKRGKKKKTGSATENLKEDGEKDTEEKPSSIVLTSSPKPPVSPHPSLVVSETILGFGSHGTVVFKGSLQGRAVAVKRLLQDFVTLAAREVSILQESDDHPNVIRYYYQESHGNFLYIALELCPCSLADIIETPDRDQWREIAVGFDPKRALKQIAGGLRHLHALKLVHRDIKPQNILVSAAKNGSSSSSFSGPGKGSAYRMLISDFGLCKKLDVDQTSFLPTAHGSMAAGTVGWRAPEILRGEVKLDEPSSGADDGSLSSRGSVTTVNGSNVNGLPSSSLTRLTKRVDIFALGCLFYYTLTSGGHPYGDRYEREGNIMRDVKDLSALERFGEEGTEAKDLIGNMLSFEASGRPDTTTCLLHPFFWDPGRRLNFLQDASDRFEIMCRDPKDPDLLTLEKSALQVVGNDWHARLDRVFIDNLGKYRKYDGRSVQDLLRALRNKKHHYQDLPGNVIRHLGPMPEGFLGYFTRRFPRLFLHVHGVIKETGLHKDSMFRAYFELPDS